MPKILLVDDEVEIREALGKFFEKKGFTVSYAGCGNDAIGELKSNDFDFVVSDVRMPNGDGVSVMRYIRDEVQNQPLAILLTGFADYSNQELLDAGATRIFEKPISRKEIYSYINEQLEKAS